MTDVGSGTRLFPAAVVLFATIGALMALDLVADRGTGVSFGHIAAELAAMVAAVAGAGMLWAELRRARRATASLGRDLTAARAEAERWRTEAGDLLRGLGEAVDAQFERWALTPAEREVALLLLKGLSHKEVAQVRDTSERTVRQQALAVYRKAGLAGRAELAAFFFEDLLLPRPAAAGEAQGG